MTADHDAPAAGEGDMDREALRKKVGQKIAVSGGDMIALWLPRDAEGAAS